MSGVHGEFEERGEDLEDAGGGEDGLGGQVDEAATGGGGSIDELELSDIDKRSLRGDDNEERSMLFSTSLRSSLGFVLVVAHLMLRGVGLSTLVGKSKLTATVSMPPPFPPLLAFGGGGALTLALPPPSYKDSGKLSTEFSGVHLLKSSSSSQGQILRRAASEPS